MSRNQRHHALMNQFYDFSKYNTECLYCDQGGKNHENTNPRLLFDVEFKFDYLRWTGRDLFKEWGLYFGFTKHRYILRICRYCGHTEKFDYEIFVRNHARHK